MTITYEFGHIDEVYADKEKEQAVHMAKSLFEEHLKVLHHGEIAVEEVEECWDLEKVGVSCKHCDAFSVSVHSCNLD